MTVESRSTPQQQPWSKESTSASLLVRCWLEAPAHEGEPPILRGYVKNLTTGEELFIKDLESVGQQIRRQLAAGAANGESGAEDRSGRFAARVAPAP